jgi:hypothetical protein
MYSLEYTDIPNVFFTPQHGRDASMFILSQTRLRGTMDLLERNDKCMNGTQGRCCDNVIQGHSCEPTMTGCHFCKNVLQLPRFQYLKTF